MIDTTLEFVTHTTSAPYQSALRASLQEATAAGYVQTGKFHDAAATYGSMVATHPDDARLRLAYGEALLRDGQAAVACGEFDTLRDKGLGYRDLGLPAARACLQKGDPEAALAWLRSIPPRYLLLFDGRGSDLCRAAGSGRFSGPVRAQMIETCTDGAY